MSTNRYSKMKYYATLIIIGFRILMMQIFIVFKYNASYIRSNKVYVRACINYKVFFKRSLSFNGGKLYKKSF